MSYMNQEPASGGRMLMIVVVLSGFLVALAGVAGVFMLNENRSNEIEAFAKHEAYARYEAQIQACTRGNVLRVRINEIIDGGKYDKIPIVDCAVVIPKPEP